MKSKTPLILLSSLILTVGYLSPVQAVTDAELEALEKQIEQQEVEEKKQAEAKERKRAEAETKRKAEEKRKAEAEVEQKRLEEEKNKLEQEKRNLEEARQAELDRKRQEEEQKKLVEQKRIEEEKRKEEEAKKRAEEEKKKKYNLLLSNGRDLALIKEGATLSIPTGEDPSSSKNAAIDGIINNYGVLHGWAASSWNLPNSYLLVTLKEVSLLNKIRFLLWDKDNRFYQYRLEVSKDQQQWEVLSDNSSGEWRSWQEIVFEPKEVKYIKIIGLYGSATFLFSEIPWFHVVEIEAFGLSLSDIK